MNKSKTEIVFIIDRSGSMSDIARDMRGGFNTLIEEQKKVPGECLVTLTQFDHEYESVYAETPIANVPKLTLVPRGSTALLDAIGLTIVKVGERLARTKEEDRPGRVMIVIVTDGQENASKEYTREQIVSMISEQKRKYSWDFLFLGADENAISVAQSYGIGANAAVKYRRGGRGAEYMMRGVSKAVSTSRTHGGDVLYSQAMYDADLKKPEPK